MYSPDEHVATFVPTTTTRTNQQGPAASDTRQQRGSCDGGEAWIRKTRDPSGMKANFFHKKVYIIRRISSAYITDEQTSFC